MLNKNKNTLLRQKRQIFEQMKVRISLKVSFSNITWSCRYRVFHDENESNGLAFTACAWRIMKPGKLAKERI